jgi:predicted DCC family thiol-disulfide oxidoreductase YuxK
MVFACLPGEDGREIDLDMQKPVSLKEHNRIILFDGACNLCSGFMRFVYKYDSKKYFKFAWIQEEKGKEILEWLGLPTDEYATIILIKNGQAFYKSNAFLKIVRYLRFPWPVLNIGIIIPIFIRDWIYDMVARNRYRLFGKKDHCLVPTGDLLGRFF